MSEAIIDEAVPAVPPHAPAPPDYRRFMQELCVQSEAARLHGDLDTGINAYSECCGRHLGSERTALRAIAADGSRRDYSFEQLDRWSAQFANILRARGIGAGDRVAALLPRKVDLLVVVLGTWRAGAVYLPLFTAFGPKSIEHRLHGGEARLVVTDRGNRGKLDGIDPLPPVLTVDAADPAEDFAAALAAQPDGFEPVPRRGEDLFLMLFTSGTTGLAKGVPVPLKALLAFSAYMRYAVDLRPDDVLWNIADPGWAYGIYYGVTGPLMLGHTIIFNEGGFTIEGTYRLIRELGVTNLMGSPTAYRMLMTANADHARTIRGQLRAVSSAGEPLNPEVIRWFAQVLDTTIHDHYGQTETGMTVCNHHALAHRIQPGSAGFALPGYRVAVLDKQGNELAVGVPGELAVDRPNSPLYFFPGYWQQAKQDCFRGPYYLTGDTVELNEDGSIAFVGRSDDVITSSGYRIGPFDVESSLLEHPAVVEAAVVGKPDPKRTEIVKAFVVLHAGHEGNDALARELAGFVKQRLAAHAYPREIEFCSELPKTPSGKIQRFLLRQQGLAAGSA
ncbi:AMP-binding protein [Stenotrophomonas sp. MMGLT7]|uniref:AMP-binding protein n=1 Tax=Stenotrophomonas sp. MMGLT7 TaxID=2901227 RepID=UPI001E5C4A58|nr:AMP-binding protein [Stenotrophomonas sp. MMGLT7]MCD7097877.1 AMP-binding protein [Stenotrophomonas sp. MMGLT7]